MRPIFWHSQVSFPRAVISMQLALGSSNLLSARVSALISTCPRQNHCGASTPHLSGTHFNGAAMMEPVTEVARSGPSRLETVLHQASKLIFSCACVSERAHQVDFFRFSQCS